MNFLVMAAAAMDRPSLFSSSPPPGLAGTVGARSLTTDAICPRTLCTSSHCAAARHSVKSGGTAIAQYCE